MDEICKKNVYDVKWMYVVLNCYVGKMIGIVFDVLLVVYLFDINDNNVDIEGVV